MPDNPDEDPPLNLSAGTKERLRLWGGLAVLFGLYSWLVFATTFQFPGKIGLNYNTPGTDWMVYQQAVRDFMSGNIGQIFDDQVFAGQLATSFGTYLSEPLGFRPWLYPLHYLFYVAPFGLLPFRLSYLAFMVTTFIGMSVAVASFAKRVQIRRALLGSMALNPATSITVLLGQNSFLTAGLLLGGVRLTRTMPLTAGLLFGLLSYKPQLCLMIPVALIADRRWKVLATAAATTILLIVASIAIIGVDPWRLWIDRVIDPPPDFARNVLDYNILSGVSVYGDCQILGLSKVAASIVQLILIGIAGSCVAFTFNRPTSIVTKIGVLLPASLLAAPYLALYDLVPLAIAVSWLIIRAVQRGDIGPIPMLLGVSAWTIPLLNPPHVNPIGFATPFLCLYVMVVFMKEKPAREFAPA